MLKEDSYQGAMTHIYNLMTDDEPETLIPVVTIEFLKQLEAPAVFVGSDLMEWLLKRSAFLKEFHPLNDKKKIADGYLGTLGATKYTSDSTLAVIERLWPGASLVAMYPTRMVIYRCTGDLT